MEGPDGPGRTKKIDLYSISTHSGLAPNNSWSLSVAQSSRLIHASGLRPSIPVIFVFNCDTSIVRHRWRLLADDEVVEVLALLDLLLDLADDRAEVLTVLLNIIISH